jgi:hypothetical protein
LNWTIASISWINLLCAIEGASQKQPNQWLCHRLYIVKLHIYLLIWELPSVRPEQVSESMV